jgi:Laminin G domain
MGGSTTTRLAAALAAPLATALALAAAAPTYAHGLDPDRDLRLNFDRLDAGGLPVLDAVRTPGVLGAVSSVRGGQVTAGPDRSSWGHSLRMEPFRPGEPAHPAVVVVRPGPGAHDRTDPGHDDFAFGADFVLDAETGVSPTDNGDNLVQRGLFGPAAQYKIQLDGGHPSCRVSGSEGAVVVRATDAVQPGQWYRVRCRRVGDVVTLRVVSSLDSVPEVRAYAAYGSTGTLSYGGNAPPFAIGGKVDAAGNVLADDSDQFNGLIDNVVFRHLD